MIGTFTPRLLLLGLEWSKAIFWNRKESMLRTHVNCKFLALQSTTRKPTAQAPGKIQKQGDVGLFHQHLTFLQTDDTYVKEVQGK